MTSRRLLLGASFALNVVLFGAGGCGATNGGSVITGGGGAAVGGGGGEGGGIDFGGSGGGTGGGPLTQEPKCEGVDPNLDNDGDGWSGAQGDCNDCTPQMNPGAQDYPGNNIDEDCNGAKDDNPVDCDGALNLASPDPMDGARAMGICKVAQGQSWGVVSAKYITSDGQPLENYDYDKIGWGILPAFGPNVKPQEGGKVLALSSGTARQPSDPGYDSVGGHHSRCSGVDAQISQCTRSARIVSARKRQRSAVTRDGTRRLA